MASQHRMQKPLVTALGEQDAFILLKKLAHKPYPAFLDSAARSEKLGRFSYLACAPFGIFKTIKGRAYWNGKALTDAPFVALQSLLNRYKLDTCKELDGQPLPPFQAGAIGYFAYEAGRLLENIPATGRDEERIADIILPFYDLVIAFDHGIKPEETTKAWLFSSGFATPADQQREKAEERSQWLLGLLQNPQPEQPDTKHTIPDIKGWRASMSRNAFEKAVEQTEDYILAGDIFQANITQRFSAKLPKKNSPTPLELYQALRLKNPAPFAAFLDYSDHCIASSSPERFVTLSADGNVETRPIKGTAPRDLDDPIKDKTLADALKASEKDRAENIMITDLMRNDLSRVCEPGSIKVPDLCTLESYTRIHHLVSSVTGKMKQELGPVALLGACFPGGSITGAPKIRAMEIITELEDLPRNVYCGSIGYIGFDGTMDTNIAIRTLVIKKDEISFNVGGGMTALSNPHEEYEESLHKAAAIFRAMGTNLEKERENLAKGPIAEMSDQEPDI